MKKNFTLLLIASLAVFQTLQAQTNPALVNNFKIDGDTRSGYHVSWTVANNEVVGKFELQKSVNGRDFSTISVLTASVRRGTENYSYYEAQPTADKVLYRLKMVSKGLDVYYSNILLFQSKPSSDKQIRIIGNPVNDKLTFSVAESFQQPVDVKVFNMSGKIVLNQRVSLVDRSNIVIVPLSSSMPPGIYVMEVSDGPQSHSTRFVKQ